MTITINQIEKAAKRLEGIVEKTPLQYNRRLSEKFGAKIYIKREDLQVVRSFKIRGAYNKMSALTEAEKARGVVCASAGNHAQGVGFSCYALKIKGAIFMPAITPNQKIEKVRQFGKECVEVILTGSTFDEAYQASQQYCKEKDAVYVHPFNDPATITGQGTVGKEIYDELGDNFDYLVSCIGGGGLISGVSTYLKGKNPALNIVGVEPKGAASMNAAIGKGSLITLENIDPFVDGAAVQTVGHLTLDICQKNVGKIVLIPEGKVCTTMIELYQNEGIVAEPAGALSISALDSISEEIKGKTVVCILSGGNNDILRYPEILERSLVYQGRKHYFIIEFAQKPGQLKKFVNDALGPSDDIARFEYIKKTNKERGPALVGIELQDQNDLQPLLGRMESIGLNFKRIDSSDLLYQYLV